MPTLLLPTLPLPPTLEAIRQGASVLMLSSLVRPFNLSGHPALSIPVAIAGSPLKAGLQLVGRKMTNASAPGPAPGTGTHNGNDHHADHA
jgi:Asp-tRNA(Asn)/Glu-tRNA(Gln) amidotransferase A subunit family amidase